MMFAKYLEKIRETAQGKQKELAELRNRSNPIVRPRVKLTYTIKPGDALSLIARNLGVPLDELLQDNNLTTSSVIHPGQQLVYHQVKQNTGTYTVGAGDNLTKIANKLGVPVLDLIKLNNISNPNVIHVGDQLKYLAPTREVHRWKDVKAYESQLNEKFGLDYKGLINLFYSDRPTGGFYMIDDKKNNTLGIYKDGRLVRLFNVIHGANGQQQSWNARQRGLYTGAVDDDKDNYTITFTGGGTHIKDAAGNLSTPAGAFYAARTLDYKGHPAWVRYSEKGNPTKEQKDSKGRTTRVAYSEVPSSMHFRQVAPGRFSNGCTGISAHDLKVMDSLLGNSKDIPVYVLPHDTERNRFFVRNGVINFSSSIKPHEYKDASGKTVTYKTRDENGNLVTKPVMTSPQLNGVSKGYRSPIKFTFDGVDAEGNPYDTHQRLVVSEFADSLSLHKKDLMKDLGINDDTYNELASAALGILGRESSYGAQHSDAENIVKGITKKFFGASTSPDIYRKYEGFDLPFGLGEGARGESHSVGLTLLRLNYFNKDEKKLMSKYHIKEEDLVYDPEKAAIATMIHLSQAYKDSGLSVDGALNSWNPGRENYAQSVRNLYDLDFDAVVEYKIGGRILKKKKEV